VDRRNISSGSVFEGRYGYSRAVVAGGQVFVSGTAPQMPDGVDPPEGAYEQAVRCLEIIREALAEAGATPADVVRTRTFITDPALVADVMRAHGEMFGAVRPAATCVVTGLLDPRWLVEIEAEALLP
jgi:enamine deaminase RidA (YjgF/YER057c/UK114 family)